MELLNRIFHIIVYVLFFLTLAYVFFSYSKQKTKRVNNYYKSKIDSLNVIIDENKSKLDSSLNQSVKLRDSLVFVLNERDSLINVKGKTKVIHNEKVHDITNATNSELLEHFTNYGFN